jgi:hypothetical protein
LNTVLLGTPVRRIVHFVIGGGGLAQFLCGENILRCPGLLRPALFVSLECERAAPSWLLRWRQELIHIRALFAAAGGAPDHQAGDGQPEGVPPPLRQEAAQARQDELRPVWSLEPLHGQRYA